MSRIHIVGAGPGRADLLTVRAAWLLAAADAVLYDRLVSSEVLALVNPAAEMHGVGKDHGKQEETQQRILDLIEDCARRHATVVRLKGGDPMVFGRGAEEWAYLAAHGWNVEIVPGISSAVAVPELAGIPLTYRGVSGGFAVVTGHRKDGCAQDWAAYQAVDTLVILMGVKQRAEISACLRQAGRAAETPVAIIENGTLERELVTVTTLAQLVDVDVQAPAVIVVGEVVRLRAKSTRAEKPLA